MSRRNTATLTLALAALLVPLATAAQENQPPPEVQQWVQEIQQIEMELQPVQEQALQDPVLQQEQQEVATVVRDAMVQADPANGEALDRMEEIMEEARVAQEAGDAEKIAALTAEAADIQPKVREAQAEALAQPEVQTRVAQFQENLRAKMIEIDPSTRERIERLQELSERVQALTSRSG